MKNRLRVDQAKVRETHVGSQRAAVVTEEIAPHVEGQMRTGCWGVSLLKQGKKWLIDDFDFLPNDKAIAKYLAKFREQEPNADRIVGITASAKRPKTATVPRRGGQPRMGFASNCGRSRTTTPGAI